MRYLRADRTESIGWAALHLRALNDEPLRLTGVVVLHDPAAHTGKARSEPGVGAFAPSDGAVAFGGQFLGQFQHTDRLVCRVSLQALAGPPSRVLWHGSGYCPHQALVAWRIPTA